MISQRSLFTLICRLGAADEVRRYIEDGIDSPIHPGILISCAWLLSCICFSLFPALTIFNPTTPQLKRLPPGYDDS